MISKKMEKALNDQIAAELYSSYLYLSMSANFAAQNWRGMAHWMRAQASEENEHAMKIFDFVIERAGTVALQTIKQPPTEWATPLAAFKETYAHEQKVTGMINDLVALARAEKDNASEVFLHWFVHEQVDEEARPLEIVLTMKTIGDSKGGMFMLDHKLGERK